ncbi:MAG: efflux RND transporter permease subunit, partial [Chitinophagaceae bacterium]
LDKKSRGLNKFFYLFNEWFRKRSLNYTLNVKKCIQGTKYVLILLVCLFIGTFLLFKNKPTGFLPSEDEGRLIATFELPEAASTTRSLEVLDSMMAILKSTPGINHYAALGGLNAITFASKSNSGTIFTQLKPWDERTDKSLQLDSLIATLNRKFSSIRGANVLVISPPAIPGLGQSGGFTFELQQRESTDDITAFEKVVKTFVDSANKRPELSRVITFFTAKTPGYQVDIDREKAKRLGISLSDVYSTMQTFLGSRYVNDFTLYGRNFRVVAQADTGFRKDITDLTGYYVRNNAGQMIPMSTIMTYKVTESAPLISHYNLFRTAEIIGGASPGHSSGEALEVLQQVAAQVLPEGYGFEFSGLSREEISAGNSSTLIFGLSILFVFLFLAALYESWSVPFSVLLAVPLGAFGAILTLTLIPRLNNNIYAQIGLITLIGLSAKNAILIVEFAKERVDAGMPVISATLDAVKLRLRPILMTSMAFILGVLPLALATGAGGQARATIGWTVLGGMIAATALAIFIVPVLFVAITRLAYGKKKLEEMRMKGQEKRDV